MPEDLAPSPGLLRVKIVCPLYPVADLEAESVQIPASQGTRLILPGRAPLFCLLNAGELILNNPNGTQSLYLISSGVCEVRRDICAVMAWGIRADDIDLSQIQKHLQDAEAILAGQVSSVAHQELIDRIAFYRFILNHTPHTPSAS